MKTVERRQWLRSVVFIVKCEFVSHFEQENVCWVDIENINTISFVMLRYFQCEQNLWTNNMWTHTITTLVNKWEILSKEFSSDVDPGDKDAAHIQNGLLYIKKQS